MVFLNITQTFYDEDVVLTEAPYTTSFEFEKFDLNGARAFMKQHAHISLYASIVYIVLIFSGQVWMKNRAPFHLRSPLAVWNVLLAIFSVFGLLRVYPEFHSVIFGENGFHRSLCVRDEHNVTSAFWGLMFVLSKMVELGDTVFIVLRKQRLIFLHWYHHITVLMCCWYFYSDYEPIFRWYGVMNYFVHSLMYSYYAARALQVKIARPIAMTITALQLTQMVVGLLVNLYSFKILYDGYDCARRADTFYTHISICISYMVLFANYFYKAYFVNPKTLKKE